MKLLTTTATTVAFAVLAGASFAADSTSSTRPSGGKGRGPKPDPAAAVAHLTEEYSKVSSFDLDHDGQLSSAEQGKLAEAIKAGTVSFGPPAGRTPPEGDTRPTPPAGHMAGRIAEVYAALAPYDANADGSLSADEQATLKTAIESGKLTLPGGPGGGRGHGHKGGKGGPDDSEG